MQFVFFRMTFHMSLIHDLVTIERIQLNGGSIMFNHLFFSTSIGGYASSTPLSRSEKRKNEDFASSRSSGSK